MIYIEDKSFVAFIAEDRHAQVTDGRRKVAGDWLEGGADGIHCEIVMMIFRWEVG